MSILLSICIPVYNRASFLSRTLDRFLGEKDLFMDSVQLFVSDNCSTEDIGAVCQKYSDLGLKLQYNRNSENLGMDANFEICFKRAEGKYVLLLGSDDIPVPGFVGMLTDFLKGREYGLVHLRSMNQPVWQIEEYTDRDAFLTDVKYWITFISANIVATEYVKDMEWKLFHGTMITQVPLYLEAAGRSRMNAVLTGSFYEEENDSKNNGGYNLFKVFVDNLLNIFCGYVEKGMISRKSFKMIKKMEYKEFLTGNILECLILKRKRTFDLKAGWKILWRHYGRCPYAYWYLFEYSVDSGIRKIEKSFKRQAI